MTADDLVSLFDLESFGPDRYVGHSPPNGWKRVFGGQVIAQALIAAQRTVEGRTPHSLHVYFILGGDPREPILFEVERIRDGRSFTTRRVVARQRGEAIFALSASFQVEEEGLGHQFPMPDVPDPEVLPDPVQLAALAGEAAQQRVKGFFDRIRPIELRPLDLRRYQPAQPGQKREPRYSISSGKFQVASLDHALWLHRPFRADEWLLYVQESPSACGGRGLIRGLLYQRGGALVASVAQEGLLRPRRPGAES